MTVYLVKVQSHVLNPDRKSAAKSREKRINDFQDLEIELGYHTTIFETEEETLAEITRINASIIEKIKKIEEEREILKLVRYLHNTV